MVLQDNLHFINKFKQVVFFQIKSENRNPTKCEIEFRTTVHTTDLSQASYKLTKCREHLRAAATAAASNKGLFT